MLRGTCVMHVPWCVTHVPWCMSGLLTRGGGENVPGIPRACAIHNFKYLASGPWKHKLYEINVSCNRQTSFKHIMLTFSWTVRNVATIKYHMFETQWTKPFHTIPGNEQIVTEYTLTYIVTIFTRTGWNPLDLRNTEWDRQNGGQIDI